MANVIYWPELLRPQNIKIDIAHRSLAGPSAQSGYVQVVSNSAGLWVGTYDSIPVYSKSMIKCWRALDSLIEGRQGIISIPTWDFQRSPGSSDELGSNIWETRNIPHSDASLFDDGSGYTTSWSNVYLSSDASTGATTLYLTINDPIIDLEPGHRFSINDRLYQIKSVSQSDSAATVTIRPPLREAVSTGDRVEFDYPRVKMRLTDDSAMNITLNYNANVFPTLSFIEAL